MRLSQTSPLDPKLVAAVLPTEATEDASAKGAGDALGALGGDAGQIQPLPSSQPMPTIQLAGDAGVGAVSQAQQQAALEASIDEGRALQNAADIIFDQSRQAVAAPKPLQIKANSWLNRLPEPLAATAKPTSADGTTAKDGTVTTASMMETAEAILRQFLFLADDRSLAGNAYRQLQRALREVWTAPDDVSKKLALYSRLTHFVQMQRTADLSRGDYAQALASGYRDVFGEGLSASDAQLPRPAAVQDLLDTLGFTSIRELQQAAGLRAGDVDGNFGPKTYFFVQLHLLELMAQNLNQRDRLANALLTQKLQAAEHTVTWVQSLRGNLSDRLTGSQLDPSVQALIKRNGYRVENGQLIDRAGRALSTEQANALGHRWLDRAIRLADEAHQNLQEIEQLHRGNLSDQELKAYEDASASYRRLYSQLHDGKPAQPATAQEAVTDEALRGHVAQAEDRLAFLDRARKEGVDERTLTTEQSQSIERLNRYVQRRNGKLFLVMSENEWRRASGAVDFVTSPKSPAARALSQGLRHAITTLFEATALAQLHGLTLVEAINLGIGRMTLPSRIDVADQPTTDTPETPAESAAPPAPVQPVQSTIEPTIDTPEAVPPHRRLGATGQLRLRGAAILLDDDETKRSEQRYHEEVEAARKEADTAQAKGAEAAKARRRAQRVTGQQVVRGLDGQTVAYATNADGQVVGLAATPASNA